MPLAFLLYTTDFHGISTDTIFMANSIKIKNSVDLRATQW